MTTFPHCRKFLEQLHCFVFQLHDTRFSSFLNEWAHTIVGAFLAVSAVILSSVASGSVV